MKYPFKTGDQMKWNSKAGHVSCKIIKIHTSDFDYKGYTHHATKDDRNMPYNIKGKHLPN